MFKAMENGLPMRSCVAVMIMRGEKFLLAKKPRKEHAWQLAQGGVEAGESKEEAAKREIKEELGLDLGELTPLSCRYVYEWPEELKCRRGFCGQEVCFFVAEMPEQEVVFNDDPYEPKEARLVSLEEALELLEDERYKETIREVYDEAKKKLKK